MEEIIDYIIEEKKKGRDNQELELELINQGTDAELARQLVKKADSIFLDQLIYQDKGSLLKFDYRITAYALITLGVGVTLLTYTGIIDLGNVYLVFYGPIIAGIAMMARGNRSKKKGINKSFKSPYDKWK